MYVAGCEGGVDGADVGAAALRKEGDGWDGVPRNSPRATPERAVDHEGCHQQRQVSTRFGPYIHLSTPQICHRCQNSFPSGLVEVRRL